MWLMRSQPELHSKLMPSPENVKVFNFNLLFQIPPHLQRSVRRKVFYRLASSPLLPWLCCLRSSFSSCSSTFSILLARLRSTSWYVFMLPLHSSPTKRMLTFEQLWIVYNKGPFSSHSKSYAEATRLKREVVRLKRELTATSAQDEFSKWAKLRRQHDKTVADYDKAGASYLLNVDS